jgi:hypothetical protein
VGARFRFALVDYSFLLEVNMGAGRAKSIFALFLGAGLALGAKSGMAVTVTNASFESPVTSGYIDDSSGTINNPSNSGFWGWGYYFANTSVDHDSGVQANTNAQLTGNSPDGTPQDGWVNGAGNYLYQDIGSLAANTTYTLTVSVAAPGGTAYGGTGSGNAQPTDTLELLNGTNTLSGSSNNIAVSGTVLASSPTITPANGSFTDFSVSTTTGASVSGDLTILLAEDTAGAHEQGIFDDVRVSAVPVVPEPASASLIGITSLLLLKRKHGQRQS